MEPNQKIQELEAQIKLLKNEVHETLLDIRENILDRQNPFSSTGSPVAPDRIQTVVVQEKKPLTVNQEDEKPEAPQRSMQNNGATPPAFSDLVETDEDIDEGSSSPRSEVTPQGESAPTK